MQHTLEIAVSPAEFFNRAKSYEKDWHESRLPATMRERGVSGILFDQFTESRFEIRLRGMDMRFGAAYAHACSGHLEELPNGSKIYYRVGVGVWGRQFTLLVGVAVLIFAIGTRSIGAFVVGAVFFLAFIVQTKVGEGAMEDKAAPEFDELLRTIAATPSNTR